jgi:hypothetical protein
MIDAILALIPGNWLAGIGAALAAALGIFWAGKRDGKAAAKIETLERNNEAYEVRNEVENRLAGSDAHKRLRDEWSK